MKLTLPAAVAMLWCACSANRATEVSRAQTPPAPAVVHAGAHGWTYLENGQKLQMIGHAPLRVNWLFTADPCSEPMRYGMNKSVSTAECTISAHASGAFAFQIEGQPEASFVRVGRAENSTPVPLELIQARLRARQSIHVANVALGCREGKAYALPEELAVSPGEFVSWTRLGSRPPWTVTFPDDAACGNARLSDSYSLCVIGSGVTDQSYAITLEGCPQPGSGKLMLTK